MKTFLDRVKRIRGGQATAEDLADESLPLLEPLIGQLDFDAAAQEHATKTTN